MIELTRKGILVTGMGEAGLAYMQYLKEHPIEHVQLMTWDPNSTNDPANYKLLSASLLKEVAIVFLVGSLTAVEPIREASAIARIAKDQGVLTIGLFRMPYLVDGENLHADLSLELSEVKNSIDSLITLPSNDLDQEVYNFSTREENNQLGAIIGEVVKTITQVVNVTSEVSIDLDDLKSTLANAGTTLFASAEASGPDRAVVLVQEALMFPLLTPTKLVGAQQVIVSVTVGDQTEIEMDELTEILDELYSKTGGTADFLFGHSADSTLGNRIRLALLATGFSEN